MYPHATEDFKMSYETLAIIKSLLADFEASDSQYLLLAGDITNNGTTHQHEIIRDLFKEFEERTGKSIFVAPGNHDTSTHNPDRVRIEIFKDYYADFGYNEALSVDEDSGSYTVDLDAGYRLIVIDSLTYTSSAGIIKEGVEEWIKEQAAVAKADGKKLIGMQHHGVVPHFRLQALYASSTLVEEYDRFAELYADLGIQYVFTGHVHCQSISGTQSANGNRIYDVETGSFASTPHPYRIVTFSDSDVDISTRHLESIDVNDLPEGFNDAQIAAIQADFQAYSKGYSEVTLNLWINNRLRTKDVAETFGIEEGTTVYAKLDSIMKIVREALALPLL